LYKLDIINNKINIFEEKIQFSSQYDINEECSIQFPLSTFNELILFEAKVKEKK